MAKEVAGLIFTLALAGCGDLGPNGGDDIGDAPETAGDEGSIGLPDDRNMAAPEGVMAYGDRVFVTNANFAYQGSALRYGTGFVTVIDAVTAEVVNRIELPFKNPQELAVYGGRLWVLCSGETTWNATESTVVVKTAGGLAGIDLEAADTASSASTMIPLPAEPGSFVGYPSGLLVKDGIAWLASGTAPALFYADLVEGVVLRGTDNPLWLSEDRGQNTAVIGPGPGGLISVGLFNDDAVMLLDPATQTIVDSPWGQSEIGMDGQLDGILDIESDGGVMFVLFGLANQVSSFDADAGPSGGLTRVATNLMAPNRMKLAGGELFVVNSGDNSVASLEVATGEVNPRRAVLPVNCNPWDLDVSERSGVRYLWVTCVKSHAVARINLDDSSLLVVE